MTEIHRRFHAAMPDGIGSKQPATWLTPAIFGAAAVTAVAVYLLMQGIKSDHYDKQQNRSETHGHSYEAVCVKQLDTGEFRCRAEPIGTSAEDHRQEDDLRAQQEMADWAYYVALFAVEGLVLSGLGVGMVFLTFGKAAEANQIARRNGETQARAYMHLDEPKVDVRYSPPRFTAWFVNSGETPAKHVEIGCVCGPIRSGTGDFSSIPEDLEYSLWSAFGGNSRRSVSLQPAGRHGINLTDFNDDEVFMSLRGRIRYVDIFDVVYETEFSFFAHRLNWVHAEKLTGKMAATTGHLRVYEKAKEQRMLAKPRKPDADAGDAA